MEIKSEQTYPVSVGYKIYSSARDDTIDEEKDGSTFEFNFKYGDSWENSGVNITLTLAVASMLWL